MQALAVALGADPDQLRMGSLSEIVWAHLGRLQGAWLLVFDNADDPTRALAAPGEPVCGGNGWLRPVSGAGLIVVTSRDGLDLTWGGGRCRWLATHPVEPLDAAEGGRVLVDLAGSAAGSVPDAEELSVRLGGLPLALRTVGSYLAETAGIPGWLAEPGTVRTFADYHRALDDVGASTLFPATGGDLTADRARELVGRTWELSLDLLRDRGMPEARALLRLLSCFADAPIPPYVLRRDLFASSPLLGMISGNRAWQLLRALAGFGLVNLYRQADRPGDAVVLHPLVRDTSAAHPDVAGDPAGFPALAARLFAAATEAGDLGDPADPAAWPAWQALAPHAAPLLRQVSAALDRLPRPVVGALCTAAGRTGQYLHARGCTSRPKRCCSSGGERVMR